MKLTEFKTALSSIESLSFVLPDGKTVAPHFHLTEIGLIHKKFIDCGGVMREEYKISFQLWEADDVDHRLATEKLLGIIDKAEKSLQLPDAEIEVEYQQQTIGKFGLELDKNQFILTSLQTDCLAKDKCGVPLEKPRIRLGSLGKSKMSTSQCDPNSGCC